MFSVSNCRLAEKSAENAVGRYLKVHTQRCPYLCDREGGECIGGGSLGRPYFGFSVIRREEEGATLHMLVPFCVDVQQHSNSTHQPEFTVLCSVVHILPARCTLIVVVHHDSSHLHATIIIMGKTRLLVMLGAGRDKLRGRLATQLFQLTGREQHFRDKRYHILTFRDKTASFF